jgi:hypothetical protein
LSRTGTENQTVSRDSASRRNVTHASISRRGAPQGGEDGFVGGFVQPQVDEESTQLSINENLDRQSQSRKTPPILLEQPETVEPEPQDPRFNPPPPPPLLNEPPPPAPPSAQPQIPPNIRRYSLVDKPSTPPSSAGIPLIVEEPASPADHLAQARDDSATPPPETPPIDAPAMASLAALKKGDALERRASKRFSTYNITKMTGSSATTRERSLRGHSNRRSMAAGASALTPGDLDVLTEVDEPSDSLRREGSGRIRNRSASRPSTPDRPPVPPLPSTPARTPEPVPSPAKIAPEKKVDLSTVEEQSEASLEPARFSVFLQLGREVKKVTIEPGLSFSSLRVLFVDKFSYNPGLENFPAIYIRDPSSGVQYELEDVDEVKEKCLLSLNIEPLDQIKQHIDTQILTLSQDIKELKTTISSQKTVQIPAHSLPDSPPPPRPTDGHFAQIARRLSRIVEGSSSQMIAPQFTGQLMPQITGGSVLSEYSSRVVTDLKTQFDEVQNLRRDLGIMRQLYTEFMKSTKESLGTLRNQTQSVKQLAHTRVGGARGYIDSGKKKLDTRSQNVLTEVEKLQDTVEGVKDDVLKRHITPKPLHFQNIKQDIDKVATELESLKEHIKTIKPMWKKTWEEELQNIVEEQQFLTHQEEFLSDLLEDYKAVTEVYGHVEKVISLRGSGPKRIPPNRNFKPAGPVDTQSGLSNVMLEIRSAAVDPERRLKAIEASQKNRERELANREDEFQTELTGFVGGKKLKMTGGAEEVERVRQKRNEMALKAMFNGGAESPATP